MEQHGTADDGEGIAAVIVMFIPVVMVIFIPVMVVFIPVMMVFIPIMVTMQVVLRVITMTGRHIDPVPGF